jgi:hypothetical protein
METNDPTEWKFANAHMDGWDHWERLCECTWFKPYAERWRKELFLRLQSEALARIMAEGKTNSKNAFTANRYLTERAWEPRGDSKRGRPTKTEVKAAAHAVAASNSQIDDDYRRLVPILPN